MAEPGLEGDPRTTDITAPVLLDHPEPFDTFADDPLPPYMPGPEPESDPGLVDELLDVAPVGHPPSTPATRFRHGLGRGLMVVGGLFVLFVLAYGTDLVLSAGKVPRGVTVAGIDVGGMSRADAEARLRHDLEPRLEAPVPLVAGDVSTELDPRASGLGVDWPGTLARAGHQPLDPVTRLMSFFTSREVGVATKADKPTLTAAVSRLADDVIARAPIEGSIGFQGVPAQPTLVTAYPVEPRQGQRLHDLAATVALLSAGWLNKSGITLPVDVTPVRATSAGVHLTLDRVAAPAVAKPVLVHGDGKVATLQPVDIASALKFSPAPDGTLTVTIDQSQLQALVQPVLSATEKQSADAQVLFTGDQPTVQPSVDGSKIDWAKTFGPLRDLLARTDGRDLQVVYDVKKPDVTTDAANALGIKEVVAEFTTSGLSGGALTNVSTLAAKINGTIVKPGATFSLDDRSGPRSQAVGYVTAPLNEDGTGPPIIGGGVSQLTSTLYNAAYLAGLANLGHAEHDYYLDRYPIGRDARSTRPDGTGVDLTFTDDAPTGIAIQAMTSGDSVTVWIWGTKRYRVESVNSGEADVTSPPVTVGTSGSCRAQPRVPGFSTTDTRVLHDLSTGAEVRSETRGVTYAAQPTVVCP